MDSNNCLEQPTNSNNQGENSSKFKSKPSQLKSSKTWKSKNPEKVKEYAKNYYNNNKEKVLEKMREQYQAKTLERSILKIEKIIKIMNEKK
jgi:hypothetical protein